MAMKKLTKELIEIPFAVCLGVQELGRKSLVVGCLGHKPKTGFAVGGIVPVKVIPLSELSMASVREFLLEHGPVLLRDQNRVFLGVWVSSAKNEKGEELEEATLDLVDVLENKELAFALGKSRKEEVLYSLAEKQDLWLS